MEFTSNPPIINSTVQEIEAYERDISRTHSGFFSVVPDEIMELIQFLSTVNGADSGTLSLVSRRFNRVQSGLGPVELFEKKDFEALHRMIKSGWNRPHPTQPEKNGVKEVIAAALKKGNVELIKYTCNYVANEMLTYLRASQMTSPLGEVPRRIASVFHFMEKVSAISSQLLMNDLTIETFLKLASPAIHWDDKETLQAVMFIYQNQPELKEKMTDDEWSQLTHLTESKPWAFEILASEKLTVDTHSLVQMMQTAVLRKEGHMQSAIMDSLEGDSERQHDILIRVLRNCITWTHFEKESIHDLLNYPAITPSDLRSLISYITAENLPTTNLVRINHFLSHPKCPRDLTSEFKACLSRIQTARGEPIPFKIERIYYLTRLLADSRVYSNEKKGIATSIAGFGALSIAASYFLE